MQCLAGCGFYASHNGYCSKCSPTVELKSPPDPSIFILGQPQLDNNKNAATVETSPLIVSTQAESSEKKESIPNPNRCFSCQRKIGLLGFDCECKRRFCKLHRYTESHNCDLVDNYSIAGKELIRKQNPLVEFSKFDKM